MHTRQYTCSDITRNSVCPFSLILVFGSPLILVFGSSFWFLVLHFGFWFSILVFGSPLILVFAGFSILVLGSPFLFLVSPFWFLVLHFGFWFSILVFNSPFWFLVLPCMAFQLLVLQFGFWFRRLLDLPTDLQNCKLQGDMAISINKTTTRAQAFMVMFWETYMDHMQVLRLTVRGLNNIIIEKSFFLTSRKCPYLDSNLWPQAYMLML